MTYYQEILSKIALDLNALHLETLAYDIGSTLNGMPREFFEEVAVIGRQMGAERLEQRHNAAMCL